MKWAYPFATPEVELPILGYRGVADEVLPALKDLGYHGIEAFVRNPEDFDTRQFEKQILRYGLEVPAIGTGPVVSEDKLTFAAKSPESRRVAIERALKIVEFASLFGAKVGIGKLRGDVDPLDLEKSMGWIREALEKVCSYAAKYHVQVLLEPQNSKIINNLNSTQQALKLIQDMKIPNLKLMLDIYHVDAEEGSVTQGLLDGKEQLSYLHVSDHDRLPPGRGKFDCRSIMRTLNRIGYKEYMTPEIGQIPDSYQAAKLAIQNLRLVAETNSI